MEEKGLVKKMLPYLPGIGMGVCGVIALGLAVDDVRAVWNSMDSAYRAMNSVDLKGVYEALNVGAIDLAKDSLGKVDLEAINQAKNNLLWYAKMDAVGALTKTVASAGCFGLAAHFFYDARKKSKSKTETNQAVLSTSKRLVI